MNVVVFGASGMIGGGAVIECLEDERVESVLTVGRRPCGITHPKLRELLHDDLFELASIEDQFAGIDACFYCVGVSSAGMDEASYRRITYDLTFAIVDVLPGRAPGRSEAQRLSRAGSGQRFGRGQTPLIRGSFMEPTKAAAPSTPAPPLGAVGHTPLVELEALRPSGGGRVLAKWEGANPTGSMKDRMARAMVEGALREGTLQPGQRVLEYTGGSTGSSLAFVCAALGHPLSIITADCFSDEKIRTMRALGADVEVHETPQGKVYPGLGDHFEKRVHEIQAETGAYWTQQLRNRHQFEGYAGMAAEILDACPEVTDFVMSAGTGGCSMGNAIGFRDAGVTVRTTLVEPASAPHLSEDRRGVHKVEGIAVFEHSAMPLLDRDLYERVLSIPEEDGRAMARRVATTTGMFVGPSSGLNLAAAVQVAEEQGPDSVVVTVLVDTGLKYLRDSLFS